MPFTHRSFRVEAIVLRHSEWGEADRILTLYTRERGKLRALAKGARRIKSRKAGHLEPFTRVTLQLAKGRDLAIITQAETVEAYIGLRDDLVRTATASTVLEILDRFTYEDEYNNVNIYHLLTETLQRISTLQDPWVALRYFEVHPARRGCSTEDCTNSSSCVPTMRTRLHTATCIHRVQSPYSSTTTTRDSPLPA